MGKTKNKNLEPTIKIEDPQSLIGVYDPIKEIASKFDFYIKIVIAIFVVSTVIMLISVGTLVIDSLHFNSTTYKEYSEKIETLDTLQETNKTLLKTVEQNQEIILEKIGKLTEQNSKR